MNIDTSKIEGYEAMSAEDKVKALEAFTIADPDYSGYVSKEVFDKKASEAASLSKQLKAKMTDEEKAKAESEAKQRDLEEKYNELLTRTQIADNKASLIAIGYDEELAEVTAKAMVEGDIATVIKNQQIVIAAVEKKAKGEAMLNTPNPKNEVKAQAITKEKFDSMTYAERAKFYQTNPELYQEFTK